MQDMQHQSLVVLLERTHYSLMQYMRSAKEQAAAGVTAFLHRLRTIRLPQVPYALICQGFSCCSLYHLPVLSVNLLVP